MRMYRILICILLCSLFFACTGTAKELPDQTIRLVFDVDKSVSNNADIPPMGLDILRSEIHSVTFLDTLENAPASAVDYSANHNGGVLTWAEPNGELFDVFVAAEGGVIANPNSSYLFYAYSALEEIHFNGCFNTSDTTAMVSMFEGCSNLEELDLSELDLSRVKDASYMCAGCSRLKKPEMGNFNYEAAVTLKMFEGLIAEPTEAPTRGWVKHPCSRCKKMTEFPFTPRGDRPVYCSACWAELRGK